jgi:hypothetical protein
MGRRAGGTGRQRTIPRPPDVTARTREIQPADSVRVVEVTIRTYERRDAVGVADVFYRSVRAVALSDYTPEQVRAWVPGRWDAEREHRRTSAQATAATTVSYPPERRLSAAQLASYLDRLGPGTEPARHAMTHHGDRRR